MTNQMFNPQPNYSGVTIQIANPAVYAGSAQPIGVQQVNPYAQNPISPQNPTGVQNVNPYAQLDPAYNAVPQPNTQMPSYPPQYYLNNYNYTNNGTSNGAIPNNANAIPQTDETAEIKTPEDTQLTQIAKEVNDVNGTEGANGANGENGVNSANEFAAKQKEYEVKQDEPQDFTKSQAVIEDLDARVAAEEASKKNTKEKRVVALTDEYIKSLENYLNNPNDEIRLMASKEILIRLDEDKDRFDDAALNALLNKMLQDPSKLIRVASLSAFASQLASGNDYTVTLLHNIQQNPNADKEDVLQAADILLKMSAGTEIKHIPNPSVKEVENKGQG